METMFSDICVRVSIRKSVCDWFKLEPSLGLVADELQVHGGTKHVFGQHGNALAHSIIIQTRISVRCAINRRQAV